MKGLEQITSFCKISMFIGCFAFVVHRGYTCLDKYLSRPISTTTRKHFSKNVPFPTVTFCPRPYSSMNFEFMENYCNLDRFDYLEEDKWLGQGLQTICEDPKEIFLNISSNLEDLSLHTIWVGYFEQNEIDRLDFEDLEFKRIPYKVGGLDFVSFPTCFSWSVPDQMIKNGIAILKFDFNILDLDVYVHQENSFMIDMPKIPEKIQVRSSATTVAFINHEITTQLDFDGLPCNSSEEANFDECFHSKIFEESMEQVGCTTPFGLNLDHICNETEKAKKATEIFDNILAKDKSDVCNYPCSFLEITQASQKADSLWGGDDSLLLRFKKFVTVTKSFYSYTELELLAEFGGYVGLFLGFSVFDISNLFEKLLFKLCRH